MVVNAAVARSRYFPLLITFCLIVIFVALHNIQTVKIENVERIMLDVGNKLPGAYLRDIKINTSNEIFCKLNYGLPTQLKYTKNDLAGSPELDQDSPFQVLYDVIEGQPRQIDPGVTYATHLTKDFVMYLTEVVRQWEGPISVAAYVSDGDPKVILDSILHFCYCIPEMYKISLHLVFRKDSHPSYFSIALLQPPDTCDIQNLLKTNSDYNSLSNNSDNSHKKDIKNWYPINVCRNVARQSAYTEFILVCDVELMPSEGLANRFIRMLENQRCVEPNCDRRVFVVPVFEVATSEDPPKTKKELVRLISLNKAVYFHKYSCPHCQKFPGLEQWKTSDPGEVIKPLLSVKREVPYHRWEPVYIGTKNEPMYNERLSWEGFQDKMLQMLEMCLANYQLLILDGAFLVHWPGIKKSKRKDEPWRAPFIRRNQGYYDILLRNISGKYPRNLRCRSKR
ncbi:beta-1,4-glucuronyltransferase 1-like [Anthonomus grandis grandis]|uniref:beta-1,4-glucuronyltransferase 1-like n=1 Tax=Anthonomus grandis grandis TaxID=2921223 RepID=UPI0021656E38|nr:beta-1,4-glucuronyltransferase 1-like [Anthonomus grandis grandis]